MTVIVPFLWGMGVVCYGVLSVLPYTGSEMKGKEIIVLAIKAVLRDAFSLKDDTAAHDDIRNRLVEGGQVTGSNMGILMLAILIASIGLNMNSTAVIIGAMLISPLMGSIQAAAYGIASSDLQLIRKSFLGLGFQVAVSLLTSTLYFKFSPISTATSELLARTQPTIWDVLIALCGGLAGIIGITRIEKSNVIPGGGDCYSIDATALHVRLWHCDCAVGVFIWCRVFVLCECVFYLVCVHDYSCGVECAKEAHHYLKRGATQGIAQKDYC